MDVATIGMSAAINAATTILLMICLYSRWILPYLTSVSNSIPAQVKEGVIPIVNEKMTEIDAKFSASVEDLKASVKATSARFQRTVNQAEKVLGGMDIDLEDEEQVDAARAQLAKSYGLDVAIQAINSLLSSRISSSSKALQEGPKTDGWD